MKSSIWAIALVVALALTALPALGASSCGNSYDVVEGQVVTLTAKPDTPLLTDWQYLWTGVDGLPGSMNNHVVTYTAPAYDAVVPANNIDTVTLTTSNTHTAEACSNLCTITFNCKPKACPLLDKDVCRTNVSYDPATGITTYSYPVAVLDYTGLHQDYYTYHWVAHNNGGDVVLKEQLDSGVAANRQYTLDWTKLDQPSDTNVEECTTLEFWITTPGSTTKLQQCSAQYCISYDPTADIEVVT